MRKIEMLDKYVNLPDLQFFGGFIYDGNDIDLDKDIQCEYDSEKEIGRSEIIDKIENNVLKKHTEKYFTRKNGKKIKEVSDTEFEIEKGQLIIFIPGYGYAIPQYKLGTIEEAISQYETLKNINDESRCD